MLSKALTSSPNHNIIIPFTPPPMGSFARHVILCNANMAMHHRDRRRRQPDALPPSEDKPTRRSALVTTVLAASAALPELHARAQSWGTRSFMKEKLFQREISSEEAVERIRQTAEGMREMRHMLDTMSWRFVLYYVRLKSSYLDCDLKNAMAVLPESRRESYVKAANELVASMKELDTYVRTPKVYESYLYYEKALKSLDDVVAILA